MRFDCIGRVLNVSVPDHPTAGWVVLLLTGTPWNEQIGLLSKWQQEYTIQFRFIELLNANPQRYVPELNASYSFRVDCSEEDDLHVPSANAFKEARPIAAANPANLTRIGDHGFVEFLVQVDAGSKNSSGYVNATVVGSAHYGQLTDRQPDEWHTVWVGLRIQNGRMFADFTVKNELPDIAHAPSFGGQCNTRPKTHYFWKLQADD